MEMNINSEQVNGFKFNSPQVWDSNDHIQLYAKNLLPCTSSSISTVLLILIIKK